VLGAHAVARARLCGVAAEEARGLPSEQLDDDPKSGWHVGKATFILASAV